MKLRASTSRATQLLAAVADQVEPIIEVGLRPRGKTVSLEPRMFPYRLEQVDGAVAYQHGRVDCQKIVAMHDRTIYSAESGVWYAAPDGSWTAR